MSVALCTLALNEMEWLPKLYEQHKDWPGMVKWVFVESADRVYAETNPRMVSEDGLSVDGTSAFLSLLSKQDPRVVYVPYGFSNHQDPAQGKCDSRSQYLRALGNVKPDLIWVLDADEFYRKQAQADITQLMTMQIQHGFTAFLFRYRSPWRPPSVSHFPLFCYEVKGGFWGIPLCRGWKWFPGIKYIRNHNTPETARGDLLDVKMYRFDKIYRDGYPECAHMSYTSSLWSREAKHRYYAARGEGRVDSRGWYVESRAAWETWRPGTLLPRGAQVVPYEGPVPECFAGEGPCLP